jgi:RNA recognition motif-containing protein
MSISKITYLKDIIPFKYFVWSDYDYTIFYFSDIIEIKLFLKELEIGKAYVVTFELIISESHDDEINSPVITLSDPILVTKNSNPLIISKFINNQLIQADNNFKLDYELLINMRNDGKSEPYILVKYNTINLF